MKCLTLITGALMAVVANALVMPSDTSYPCPYGKEALSGDDLDKRWMPSSWTTYSTRIATVTAIAHSSSAYSTYVPCPSGVQLLEPEDLCYTTGIDLIPLSTHVSVATDYPVSALGIDTSIGLNGSATVTLPNASTPLVVYHTGTATIVRPKPYSDHGHTWTVYDTRTTETYTISETVPTSSPTAYTKPTAATPTTTYDATFSTSLGLAGGFTATLGPA